MSDTLDEIIAGNQGDEPRAAIDTTDCDREPIHIPGSIQPHGILLVVEPGGLTVAQVAGDVERITGVEDCIGAALGAVIGHALADRIDDQARRSAWGHVGRWTGPDRREHDVALQTSGDRLLVEVEQSSGRAVSGVDLLAVIETAGARFERAPDLKALFQLAAVEFRSLTGFDRVMIYRFLDDDVGVVVAEDLAEGAQGFLNQHFPASDIPRQARALYVRNRVRVIPDTGYRPRPLRPASRHALDLSDSALRSVSPIHVAYLRNMGVGASASISIVRDGALWGLIACHNPLPLLMTWETRAAAVSLSATLSRQIHARLDAEAYRDRLRLRGMEDELVDRLPAGAPLASGLGNHLAELRRMLEADGVAVIAAESLQTDGMAPPDAELRALARFIAERERGGTFFTHALSKRWSDGARIAREASGVLAVRVQAERPFDIIWIRAEQVETVKWAGDPHAGNRHVASGPLTPRASFTAWSETVTGRARRWSTAQVESAARLARCLESVDARRRERATSLALAAALTDKDKLLARQDFLMREVNHRVQNSLALVSSFLALQARVEGPEAARALTEARRRIGAVSTVHQRLHQADPSERIDLARYLGDLVRELGESSGPEWAEALTLDLAPATSDADRAITIGLVVTELLINAQKYAYEGRPGPVDVRMVEDRGALRLTVADKGRGDTGGPTRGSGFGARLVASLAEQLGGVLEREDRAPGLAVSLIVPLDRDDTRVSD